jgi:uncharacterized membrane protein YgcG
MKILKIAALALAALVLPALLASATYIMSANSLDSPAGAVVRVRRPIASPNTERDRAEDKRRDDISGPCDEAEHADDPRCTGNEGGGSDDSSGPGSDDEIDVTSSPSPDDSDSDNSGPGSDNSGSGSDNSGSGSDNSGSGSDSSGSGSSGGDD